MEKINFKIGLMALGLMFLSACQSNLDHEIAEDSDLGSIDSNPVEVVEIPQDQLPTDPDPEPSVEPTVPFENPHIGGPVLTGNRVDLSSLANRVHPVAVRFIQSQDIQVNWNWVFSRQPELKVDAEGRTFVAYPLGNILPNVGDGTARFVINRDSSLPETNYLEVNFQVNYPKRRPSWNRLLYTFRLNWLHFNLYACLPNGSCQMAKPDLQGQPIVDCNDAQRVCQMQFSARVNGADLPRGGIEHYRQFIIKVEGTDAAYLRDADGNFKTCQADVDCPQTHPYCDGIEGACSGLHIVEDEENLLSAQTPEAILEMARP